MEISNNLLVIPFDNVYYSKTISSGFLKEQKSSRDIFSLNGSFYEFFEIQHIDTGQITKFSSSKICSCELLGYDQIIISRHFANNNNLKKGSTLVKVGLNEKRYEVIDLIDFSMVRLTDDLNRIESLPIAIVKSIDNSANLSPLSFDISDNNLLEIFSKENSSRTNNLYLINAIFIKILYGVSISLALLIFAMKFMEISNYIDSKKRNGTNVYKKTKILFFTTTLIATSLIHSFTTTNFSYYILIVGFYSVIFFFYNYLADSLLKGGSLNDL
jgi:hypothetical protein